MTCRNPGGRGGILCVPPLERSALTLTEFHVQLPMSVPMGHAYELRSWTKRAFLEFREFELRLLLEKLQQSLRG